VTVFVTGATGFIGSHLVEALLRDGHEVVCLARDPRKAERLFGPRGPTVVRGNLADAAALRTGCAGAELVFHVAGLTAARNREEFFAVNRDATRRVLEAARGSAPGLRRFVHVSSLSAVGPSRRGTVVAEDETPHPVSDYGRSKLAGEQVVRESGLPWTIVRPPTVYGPRDAEMLRLFRFGRLGFMPLYGDPEQELSFVYAEDLPRALIAATAPACAGRTYFACHSEISTSRATMAAIFAAARRVTGRRPRAARFVRVPYPVTQLTLWVLGTAARLAGRATLLSPDKGPELLAEAWTCSPAALERDADWRAATNLTTGLDRTATWYADHGWL
jgi:nucleoside-diphosphate-sugar epimerase